MAGGFLLPGSAMPGKEPFLEQQDGDYANRNSGIGDVKYRAEEYEVIAAFKGYPAGQITFIDGEVQHIYHTAVEETAVAAAGRHELRYFVADAVIEDKPVEHAIYQVAGRSGQDQGTTDQQPRAVFFPDKLFHVEEAGYYRYQPEGGEQDLAEIAAKLETIGHPFILNEMDAEPVGENDKLLLHEHVRLDPEFQRLINHQDKDNNKNYVTIFQLILKFYQK